MNSSKVSGKMFIGGLALDTTQASLRKFFEKFGEIVDCILMVDKSNSKSRGFGFVVMKDPAVVDEILKTQPHSIDGKIVECKIAIPKENLIASASENNKETNFNQNQSQISYPSTNGNPKIGPSVNDESNVYNAKKIFVGGLPPNLKESEMRAYFEKFGEIEECIIMFDKISGRPRGFGFVLYKDVEAADHVMKNKNSHNLLGKWVDCKRATPKELGVDTTVNYKPVTKEINARTIPNNKFMIPERIVPNMYQNYQKENYQNIYCNNLFIENYGNIYQNYNTYNNFGFGIKPNQFEQDNHIFTANEFNLNINHGEFFPKSFAQGNIDTMKQNKNYFENMNFQVKTNENKFNNYNNEVLFPLKNQQNIPNSLNQITEESLNEYLQNYKKKKIEEESSKKVGESIKNTKTDEQQESKKSVDSHNSFNTNATFEIKSDFVSTIDEKEALKKTASLSYYFDFQPKFGYSFKLNLQESFPYKFDNLEKVKLFNDNEEEKRMYDIQKLTEFKSESEEDQTVRNNLFGPYRSNRLYREDKYKPY